MDIFAEDHERVEWESRVLRAIAWCLDHPSSDARRVFAHIVTRISRDDAERRVTAKAAARDLAIHSTTLTTRFFRIGLPPLKRYIDELTLIRAAAIVEAYPGESSFRVALRLGFSAPTHYARWMRRVRGVTPVEFARTVSERALLDTFLEEMIRPHRLALCNAPVLQADHRPRSWRSYAR